MLTKLSRLFNPARPTLAHGQRQLAWEDAQRFIYESSSTSTMLHIDHWALRQYCFDLRPDQGMVLEFGVFQGKSLNYFAKRLRQQKDGRTIFGFDSFKGFSEEWAGVEDRYDKGRFDLGSIRPEVADNAYLVDGFIEQTLPVFCRQHEDPVSFVHIDTDTYSPAKTVLSLLKDRFQAGTVILFDELAGYPNWRNHEYKALIEELPTGAYEYIGFATSSDQADLIKGAIQIL